MPDETAKETNNVTLSRLMTKLCLDNFSVQNKADEIRPDRSLNKIHSGSSLSDKIDSTEKM